jgi:hypothetical protein
VKSEDSLFAAGHELCPEQAGLAARYSAGWQLYGTFFPAVKSEDSLFAAWQELCLGQAC